MIVSDRYQIAEWVLSRKADADLNNWTGIGWSDKYGIRCAVIYNHPAYRNINGHILSDGSSQWAKPEFIRAMFQYPFLQMGYARITAPIAENNKAARRFVEKLGFTLEGSMRGYRHDGDAQLIYGILREECRYV